MAYRTIIDGTRWTFTDLKDLLAKASPARSGDVLAGIAADSAVERLAAQLALADLPLKAFLKVDLVPYEQDEVTRLILDSHDQRAFAPIAHLTVGEFREWLLDDRTSGSRSDGARERPHPGDGGGRLQDHARAGSRGGRSEM